ncbi:hypothetical protein JCM30760_14210 [Thiomicrorhabdus hydrogeniphila]
MYSTFETEISVRPDDIDLNNHVHSSKYQDYLFVARYIQMKENYKMSMELFTERGYSWVVSEFSIQYKREITLSDQTVKVKTQIQEIKGANVVVSFWILKSKNNKIAAQGQAIYTMKSLQTGRSTQIPEDIIKYYEI